MLKIVIKKVEFTYKVMYSAQLEITETWFKFLKIKTIYPIVLDSEGHFYSLDMVKTFSSSLPPTLFDSHEMALNMANRLLLELEALHESKVKNKIIGDCIYKEIQVSNQYLKNIKDEKG